MSTVSASNAGGSPYVWKNAPIQSGIISLPFGTRIVKDVLVGIAATILIVVGLTIMAKPDISALIKNISSGDVPIPIPV